MVLTEEEKKKRRKVSNAKYYQKQKKDKEEANKQADREKEIQREKEKNWKRNQRARKKMSNNNNNHGPPGTPSGARTRPAAQPSPSTMVANNVVQQMTNMVRAGMPLDQVNEFGRVSAAVFDSVLVSDRHDSQRNLVEAMKGLEGTRGENLKLIGDMEEEQLEALKAVYNNNNSSNNDDNNNSDGEDDGDKKPAAREDDGDKKPAAQPKKLSFHHCLSNDNDDEKELGDFCELGEFFCAEYTTLFIISYLIFLPSFLFFSSINRQRR